jgi:hypothetical protein
MTFLLATPLLFILIAALVIAIAIAVEVEREGWATTFFSASIALLLWHYWSDIWGWISSNPRDTMLFTGGYIALGITWALIKWKSYISASSRYFKFLGDKFKEEIGEIGANWRRWVDALNKHKKQLKVKSYTSFSEQDEPEDVIKKVTISAADKKSTIVSWIAYWPMSIAATLLNDPIRRFFSWIYDRISGVFQRMSNNSTKGLAEAVSMHKYEEKDQKK